MAAVTLKQVEKIYPGGAKALKPISFEVPDGSFCVLVGPSGCGKSTLLRLIAGLETPSAGDIIIGNQRANLLEPMQRNIAFVFQNYALYPQMSVYDNMAYGLRNLKTPAAEIEKRVREAATILNLSDDMLKRKPRALSGGQRQRVAMGRAIVRHPAVFLFDEPLSNLDAKLRVHMRVEIRKLQRRLQTTSLYVTHDQLEAMTMADMLVVMNDGQIEQIGTPIEVYTTPRSQFVAGFIGSPAMNFLKARITQPGHLSLESGLELAYDSASFKTNPGQNVTLGLRPEHLKPTQTNGLPFTIDLIEELGSGRLVHGHVGADALTLMLGADMPLPATPSFMLAIDPHNIHLFDPATGQRLTV